MKRFDNMRRGTVVFGSLLFTSFMGMCAPSAYAQWQEEGLDGREVYNLQQKGDTLYAATDNGVYKRYPLADGVWVSAGLQGLRVEAMEALDSGVLLASRRNAPEPDTAFVFRSDNGGASWQSIKNDSMQYAESLYEPPGGGGIVYATGIASVVKSTDAGVTWHSVWGDWGSIGYGIHFVSQDPNDESTLWSGGESAIFQPYVLKSTDGGDSWTDIRLTAGGDNAVYSVAVQPGNSDYVLAGMEGRIMRSVDGGENWTTVAYPEGYPYVFGLEFSPSDAQVVYAVGMTNTTDAQPLVLHYSEDAGATWSTITYPGEMFGGRPVIDMLLHREGEHNVLYFGTNNGVYSYSEEAVTDVPLQEPRRAEVRLSPNPAPGDIINLVLQLPYAGPCEATLTDASGRYISTVVSEMLSAGEHSYSLSSSGLSSGVYMLRVATKEGTVVQRVIVVK